MGIDRIQVAIVRSLPASRVEQKLKNTFIDANWENCTTERVISEFMKAADIDLRVGGRIDAMSWMTSDTVRNVSINNAIVQLLTPLGGKCCLSPDWVSITVSRNLPLENEVVLKMDNSGM